MKVRKKESRLFRHFWVFWEDDQYTKQQTNKQTNKQASKQTNKQNLTFPPK